MRHYYWYISAFIRKHGVIFLLTVIGAIIVFSLFLPLLVRILEIKKKSYIGVVGSYTLQNLPRTVQEEVSDGLTKLQEDGAPVPDLAERWNTEDDGKTYRFVVRRNLFWQDGKSVTSDDINYNYRDVQVITTPNDVIFKLKNPFVPFPTIVSQPLIRITNEPYLIFFRKKRVLGTGKFEVLDYKEQGNRLSELVLNSPEEQKVYRFYLTEDDALAGFKRGEVDMLPDMSSNGNVQTWPNVEVTEHLQPQRYLGVFFNTSIPAFSGNELRQALNYAVEKPSGDIRAVGPISPTSWAFANVGKTYDFDMNRAIDRLISQVQNYNEPIVFELTTTPLFSTEADQIKKDWETLGQQASDKCKKDSSIKDKKNCDNLRLSVNLRITNFPDTTNFQALLVGQEAPTDPDQYFLWHTDEPTNFTHYSNVRIDSLLEKGRQVEDQKKRFVIYQDFQQFFSEDAPVIFLRHLYSYSIKRK
jgi:peptide/nickel transport system substrate-binding protein